MSKRYQRRAPGSDPALEVPVRDHHRENQVDRVRRRVEELVEGWSTRAVQDVEPDGPGGEVERRVVVLEHPSLLEQLRGGGSPPPAVSSTGRGSKPPARLDAVSHLRDVEREVLEWGQRLVARSFLAGLQLGAGSTRRRTVLLLEVLAARAPVLPPAVLDALDRDVLRWWGAARIITAWDDPPQQLAIPCMACEAFGKIQVRLVPLVAVCMECRAVWDEQTISVLGYHVRMSQRPSRGRDDVADLVDKLRGHGRAAPGATSSVDQLLAGVGPTRPWTDAPGAGRAELSSPPVV